MSDLILSGAFVHPELRPVADKLRLYEERTETVLAADSEHWRYLSQLKREAVARNDQLTAKAVWCLESIGRIQDQFVSAFVNIGKGEFQQAWDQLEHCEIGTLSLERHFIDESNEFGIEHVRVHTKQLQELYHLNMGLSSALVREDIRCSICDTKITLRGGCDHEKGEIYDGEMCGWVITRAKMLHVSLVDKPAHKYAMVFPKGNDDPRFAVVKSVVSALRSPWHGWRYQKEERRQHHPVFKNARPDQACPCESSLAFKDCCLGKETVFPHFQFSFEVEPPCHLPRFEIHIPRNNQAQDL